MSHAALAHSPKDETVILVHGIWMHGLLMQVLAWRLRRYGYQTRAVSYPFRTQSPAENAQILATAADDVSTPVVHWVAHSLGGIVWLHLVNSGYVMPPGKTVLLGSPVLGSQTAKRLSANRWLRIFLGRSVESGVLGGAPQNIGNLCVGLIRGGGWFGLSQLIIGSTEPSDCVVLHSETELAGAADITYVPHSHSLMIFSAKSARKAAEFFAHGKFLQGRVN